MTKINWPNDKSYRYWAMDRDGYAYFFKEKPKIDDGLWFIDEYTFAPIDKTFENTENLNWKESLVCRDDKTETNDILDGIQRNMDNVCKIAMDAVDLNVKLMAQNKRLEERISDLLLEKFKWDVTKRKSSD